MAALHAAVNQTERLGRAIEALAEARASPQLDVLLGCEAELVAALAALPRAADVPADQRRRLLDEKGAARAAMLRTRRLGAALTEYVRVTLDVSGPHCRLRSASCRPAVRRPHRERAGVVVCVSGVSSIDNV